MELMFMFGGDEKMRKIFKESCEQQNASFFHEIVGGEKIPPNVIKDIKNTIDKDYKISRSDKDAK